MTEGHKLSDRKLQKCPKCGAMYRFSCERCADKRFDDQMTDLLRELSKSD